MLHPSTDTARKAMLETLSHSIISLAVIAAATVLAAMHSIDTTAWTAAVGAGIGVSGGVTILQSRASNGKVVAEARELAHLTGGRRYSDPPAPEAGANYTGHDPPPAPPPPAPRFGAGHDPPAPPFGGGASRYDDPTEELDLP